MTWLVFVAGFLTRAAIAYVSDRTYAWRVARAYQREQRSQIMQWSVTLSEIEWDDGKGEYDVSDFPRRLTFRVNAETSNEAIQDALDAATDQYCMLIVGARALATPK